MIIGTEGSMDVLKGGTIILADRKGRREIEADKTACGYGKQLVDDVRNRTETAMSQEHASPASELAVRAQRMANSERDAARA